MAITASVFGVTCLVVLVISTTVSDSDALATVALALAILAFTMQLIVFVAQEAGAREQGRRNEELHGLMQALLAEIKEKTAGTHADVRTINEKLIESLLAKSVTDAQGSPGGIDYRRVAAEVSSLIERRPEPPAADHATSPPDSSEVKYPPRRPTPDDEQIRTRLKTFPTPNEAEDTLEVLRSLDEKSRWRLQMYGEDELRSRSPDSPFDPALSNAYSGELLDRGLIEPVEGYLHPVDNSPLMRLTEQGRNVARLLTAPGSVPSHLEGLEEIRDALPDN